MSEYGLELELNLKYDQYEAELAKVDADTQKVLKKLRADMKSDALKFDIQITGAKAAGDTVRAYQLEIAKLTHSYKAQETVVNGLRKRLAELNSAQEKDVKLIAQVNALLDKETLKMNKLKIQLNSMDTGFADKIVGGLNRISPAFAQATAEITKYKSEISSLGTVAAGALGGVAIGAAIGAGIVKAGEAIDKVATSAANANEPIYLMAERFEMAYEEAEKLHGIMAVDGTNAEAFAKSLQKLNKELLAGGTGVASQMLRRYNVELQKADGTQKSYIEQTKALADAYQKAKEAGEGLNFVTATLGSGGSQFVHLLNGFDDYLAKYEAVNAQAAKDYQTSHELLDAKKANIEAQRQYAAALGEAYTPAALAGQREENTLLKRRTELMGENAELMKQYRDELATVSIVSARISQGLGFTWDTIKQKAVGALASIADALGLVTEQERKAAMEVSKPDEKKTAPVKQVDQSELEKARKKIEAAYEKISREFDDIGATEYEKQINRLKDEVKAYEKAGVDKATAEELFYAKKAELDNKLAEDTRRQLDGEAQKRKTAEEAITAVFQTETEKRIAAIEKQRQAWIKAGADEVAATKAAQQQIANEYKKVAEARLSEAERALQQNAKLARYITNEQKKGNENWQADAEKYARKLYLKNLGVRESDVQNVASIGADKLQAITSQARERTLAPITNNFTLNFDNTVVEDVTAMEKLANKVADVITPAIEKAVQGNNYGY